MKELIKLSAIHSSYPQMPDSATDISHEQFIESNVKKTLGFISEAGAQHADLVCTHEDIKGQGHFLTNLDDPRIFMSISEEIPGPTSQRIGNLAKEHRMYVAANYYEKAEDKVFNTSVLFGRGGEILGKYRKIHLPVNEKWMVTPGEEVRVFETDIGAIGFSICYDIIFPEQCRAMALNGADIIIHQTQGWGIVRYDIGEALLRVRAAENSVYMVVSKDIRAAKGPKSCIIDNYGKILAEETGLSEGIISAEFKPDFDLMSNHFGSFFSGVSSVKARYALERMPSAYSVLCDNRNPLLERYNEEELSTSPDKIRKIYEQWKEHRNDIRSNRPSKLKYTWDR